MTGSPQTRPSLVLRVRDASDDAAWAQFVEIYTPLIYGYCRSRGLQDSDAADVAQEAMRMVAKAIGKFDYDPQRGKFWNWLLTIVRNRLHNFLTQMQRQPELAGATTLRLKSNF
jgi:RNA polymerase sigma-70 factor (ECF subfamily)